MQPILPKQTPLIEIIDRFSPTTPTPGETRAIERAPQRTFAEQLGNALGYALAPVAAAVTFARRARAFHPHGAIYHGKVSSLAVGALVPIGERLAGHMILRFSTAIWNTRYEVPDNLGLAIRLRSSQSDSPELEPGDQDLLFVTARSLWQLPIGALMSNVHDYLDNDYYAIAPFDVAGIGLCTLRVVSTRPATHGTSRERRLAGAIRTGDAALRLDLRRAGHHAWEPLALLTLEPPARLAIDDRALRFSPFSDGKGFAPRGFVQAIRRGVYAGSQWIERWRQQRTHRLPSTTVAN